MCQKIWAGVSPSLPVPNLTQYIQFVKSGQKIGLGPPPPHLDKIQKNSYFFFSGNRPLHPSNEQQLNIWDLRRRNQSFLMRQELSLYEMALWWRYEMVVLSTKYSLRWCFEMVVLPEMVLLYEAQ